MLIKRTPSKIAAVVLIVVGVVAFNNLDFNTVAAQSTAIASQAKDFLRRVTAGTSQKLRGYAGAATPALVPTLLDVAGPAAAATAADTGRSKAQPSAAPSARGTWTKYATSYQAGTDAEYQSWYNLTYDTKRSVIYGVSWG
jgi:hypothetical protein